MTGTDGRRRGPYPEPLEPPPVVAAPPPKSGRHIVILYGCVVLLLIVNVGFLVYVLSRGAARDEHDEQTRKLIRESNCLMLDQLPEDQAALERARAEFDCEPGNGVPFADLPPAVQEQLAGRAPAVIVPPAEPSPAVVPEPDRMGGAGPNPPRPPAAEPPPPESAPQPSPTPSPEPGPLVDLEPITEPVCEGLRVCL